VKQRFVRVGDELADEVTIVVRGGVLDPGLLRRDALRNYAIYATYGISMLAARDLTVDELAQQVPLVRFERLTLMAVGTLRAAGLRLEATGRNPPPFRCWLRRPRRGHRAPAQLRAPNRRQSVS
jgi:hypothetical protein